ncbi:MAG TPA: DUF6121 family protein [Terrimesophilobacter sp.]|nr:DUF6121 family protein [Terrimesophilobacter sp.]
MRAALTTVLGVSVIIMTHGLLSLALDRDVIPEPDASTLVVIAMAGASVVIIFLATLSGLTPERRSHASLGLAIAAGLGVYALTPAAGALAYAVATERAFAFGYFLLGHLLSPFVLASAIITTLLILALPLLGQIRSRPR